MSWSMDCPNFFLIGTAKGGTTSLYYYLSQHPDVLMSNPKEPWFFQVEYERGIEYYWARYFKGYAGQGVAGDASTRHLYLPYVARRIHATAPNARLAVICRNPVDRCVSAYWHSTSRGVETRPFDAAIEANLERMRCGPCFETEAEGIRYAEIANRSRVDLQRAFGFYIEPGYYARYIELYQSLFGRDRIEILFFEDLQRDPNGTVNQLLGFLGLPPTTLQDASAQNEAVGSAAAWVFEFAGRMPGVNHVSPQLKTKIKQIIGRLLRRGKQDRREVSLAARRQLAEHYRPHNRRLAEMTGRDLSHWDSSAESTAVR